VRLSVGDAVVHDLSGAGNDEQTFAILFDLGALMGASGILDCQWM